MRCYIHDCGRDATHVIGMLNPSNVPVDDPGPRGVCNQHLAYELDIWADVVTSAEPGTKQYYVSELGTSVVITPIIPPLTEQGRR